MDPKAIDDLARISSLRPDDVVKLVATTEHDESWHQWSRAEIDALTLAMAARRPLLVRGEPGTGKTQLARAAAQALGRALQAITINARTEPHELLYRFDAVKRLADAQALRPMVEADYWEPGPLWRAFGWASACDYGSCRMPRGEPTGHVILLDEIDKADSDLPNSLLEILGQRVQAIPTLGLTIGGPSAALPLVIATTNEERELPPAFLRRCIVLNLQQQPGTHYADWLLQRGRAHFGDLPDRPASLPDMVLIKAARQLQADRQRAIEAGLAPPGAAEYLDLLYALLALAPSDELRQAALIDQLGAYAFVKHLNESDILEMSQRRESLPDSDTGMA